MSSFNPSRPDVDLLASRVEELRLVLQKARPEDVAEKSGCEFFEGKGELCLSLWDSDFVVSLPDFIVRSNSGGELPSFMQTLVLYYLSTADGTPLMGKWVSFAELPDGRTYNQAFQGYTGNELVRLFELDIDRFKKTCQKTGGVRIDVGGEAYLFRAFPRVPVVVNYWLGDEDFPSSCKLLFDESISHYLPTDAAAILGSNLTRRLVKSAG